jgi:predicted aconitase with swiveling domain
MASDDQVFVGRAMVAGDAVGSALILEQGLSFAMGFDVVDGRITDVHSPVHGEILTGRVLVMPVGRGSSSASTSLAEAIRLGTAPAAILLGEVDEILAIGAIVARTLYGRVCPIVVAAPSDLAAITTGATVRVNADGSFGIGMSEVLDATYRVNSAP